MLPGTANRSGEPAREPVFSAGVTGTSYISIRPLATGGMGRVELVARRDGPFFRLFARKRLRSDFVDDPEVRKMFLDEARIAGLVNHPNVVSVVDVGEDEAGPFLVMEFVEGVALSQLITRAGARRERMPVEIGLRIGAQVAEALHALHELRGGDGAVLELVHRDVSPSNVLVGFDGAARLTDLGIAKALGRAARTSAGVLKGKLGYMAPEQLRFEDPDRRSDLFALGVVLFEMLAGRRLYENEHEMEGPRRILNEPPPDLGEYRDDVEPELVELLFELLAKERAHRPATARAVARRLERILAGELARGADPDTASYVDRLFEDERKALRRDIAAIVEGGPLAVAAAQSIALPVAQGSTRARSRLGLLLAGAALVAATGVALVFTIGRGPVRPAAPAPAVSVSPPPSPSAPQSPPEVVAVATERESVVAKAAAPSPKRRRSARRASSAREPVACDPPYTVDENGQRHFKIPCLVDVRR